MPTVEYARADGVAHIRLNRPDAANAVDLDMAHTLGRVVDDAGRDESVRAVLVTGAGRRFCAGGDVASMVGAEDRAAHVFELAQTLDGALQALAAVSKPVVAAVQGAVAGAGLAVMLSCDVIVAEADTKFVFAYPGVGLTPDCGVSWLLPRALGQQRALEFALAGRAIDAATALEWGLVSAVVEGGSGFRAREIAEQLAGGPAAALGEARRLLRSSWERSRAQAGSEESATIARAVGTPYANLALESF